MKTVPEMNSPKTEGWFSVVVAYEDRHARDRMVHIYDNVTAGLADEIELHFTWWRFDLLTDPELFAEAVRSAVEAEMIVFSAHAGSEFPRQVRKWVDVWTKQRANRSGALAALIGLDEDARSGITPRHLYLRQVAERAQMDYLSHAVVPLPDEQRVSVDSILNRAATSSHLLEDILHEPHYRHFELR